MPLLSEREQQLFHVAEKRTAPAAWMILDLDGVIVRWPQYHLPKERDQANFFSRLQGIHEKNVAISVLTNRPSGAMQMLAFQLGVNYGTWITESGGTAYSVKDHKAWVVPEWAAFSTHHVPEVRNFLETSLGITGRTLSPTHADEAQFEPGMGWIKTVIVPPNGMRPEEYLQTIVHPVWPEFKKSSLFTFSIGKALDIDPIGLSKAAGMTSLLELNGIDPTKTPTLFIADATRDIPASAVLFEKGGFVGAVGNASRDFKDAVSSHSHGIVAPDFTQYHGSLIDIYDRFETAIF